jgi:hypothetical protein
VSETCFKEHAIEARSKLLHFSSESEDEAKRAYLRIVDLVASVFAEPRVIHCVRILAEKFHKARSLSEQEVRETIEGAWSAFARTDAAKAGQ